MRRVVVATEKQVGSEALMAQSAPLAKRKGLYWAFSTQATRFSKVNGGKPLSSICP